MKAELWSSVSEGQRRAVLINALLGSLLGSMNMASIVIALPAILNGIGINPMSPLGFELMMWVNVLIPTGHGSCCPNNWQAFGHAW
jgi:hypothetical protein